MADFGAEVPSLSRTSSDLPPVIMVHGAFCGGWTFDAFRRPFEAAGYAVSAPDLVGHAAGSGRFVTAGVSMRAYADQIAALVRAGPRPPVLLGHSLGGLIALMAAARAPVEAAILLAPSPPWGQPITSVVEAGAAVALYGKGAYWFEAIDPDYAVVRGYTLDRLGVAEARALYARMVPESGRALFETLNWWLDPIATTMVMPLGERTPVLAMTGGADRIHSPTSVSAIAARLGAEFKCLPGMSHWIVGEPGWRAAAAAALEWLDRVRRTRAKVESALA